MVKIGAEIPKLSSNKTGYPFLDHPVGPQPCPQHITIPRLQDDILCMTYFLTSITMPEPQTSDMHHIR